MVSSTLKVYAMKDEVIKALGQSVTDELKGLCAASNPSILRRTLKEDLLKFCWNDVYAELKERAPIFLHFIESSVRNTPHYRDVVKKCDTLIPPMCDATSQLIAVFNEGMCATRSIKSTILKKVA